MSKKPPRPIRFCACGDHAFAPLTKGFMAMVSPEDADLLKIRWRAHVTKRWRKKYVTILSPGGGALVLARAITGATGSQKADHISGQTMDNRRSNLRVCSHAENMKNQHPRLTVEAERESQVSDYSSLARAA